MDVNKRSNFQTPMEPWPGMEKYARSLQIQALDLEMFFFEKGKENKIDLLMIHGLGDEADTWRHVFRNLSNDNHVLAVDLPGFGRSSKPKRKYSPRFMMDALICFMDVLQIESTILMGNSLGGILSHAIATFEPSRVNGLILVDGSLLQNKPMGNLGIRLMGVPLLGEWLYTRLRKDPQAAFNSLRNIYHNLDGLPEVDREFLFHRVNQRVWSNGQRRAYFSTLRNMMPWVKYMQGELPGRLNNLAIPTLIIRGEHDQLFSEEDASGVAAVQPNASLKIIENVGHLPHQEAPTIFLQVVNEWLAKTFN